MPTSLNKRSKQLSSMSNKARARYLARIISVLVDQGYPGTREVRIPIKKLEECADVGMVLDEGELVIALGDKP